MIEVNIGILCASIPALKALFSSKQRERSRNGTYQYHSRERSGKNVGSGNGSTGTVIRDDSYALKDVEHGGHARPQNWIASDSEFEGERVVQPTSRV